MPPAGGVSLTYGTGAYLTTVSRDVHAVAAEGKRSRLRIAFHSVDLPVFT